MNIVTVLGVILGVLVGIILLCLGCIWIEKHHPSDEYDERQKLVRGRASSLSLVIGLLYLVGILVVLNNQIDGEKTVEPYLLVTVGILLMAMVDHTYCLLGNAALPLSQKPIWAIAGYTAMGIRCLWRFSWGMELFTLSLSGDGSKPLPYLLMGVTAFYLALMHIIQFLRDRKERA